MWSRIARHWTFSVCCSSSDAQSVDAAAQPRRRITAAADSQRGGARCSLSHMIFFVYRHRGERSINSIITLIGSDARELRCVHFRAHSQFQRRRSSGTKFCVSTIIDEVRCSPLTRKRKLQRAPVDEPQRGEKVLSHVFRLAIKQKIYTLAAAKCGRRARASSPADFAFVC